MHSNFSGFSAESMTRTASKIPRQASSPALQCVAPIRGTPATTATSTIADFQKTGIRH